MTIFDFFKILALDREAEALSSAPARALKSYDPEELDEEELDLLSAAAQNPAPIPEPYG